MSYIQMNGSILNHSMQDLASYKRLTKETELQPIESNNWLIHLRYTRREFDICKLLIEEDLENTRGFNEYSNYVMGLILRHEGKIEESLEYFEKCHTLNPLNSDNLKAVGRSLYLLGQHHSAVEVLLSADRKAKNQDHAIYFYLGECYKQLGRIGKSREYLRRAVQLGKTEMSFVALAELHIIENDINSAIDIYNDGLDLFPSSITILNQLGYLYLRIGDINNSFGKFGVALANSPTETEALLPIAAMYQDNNEFDTALSKYKLAGQALCESTALWNNMGMCFFGKGKYIAAISCLKRANYLDPMDWKTLYNLGLVHMHTKQYSSAFHFISSAIKLKHKHAESFMLLAIILNQMEDYENATKCFEQGLKINNEDVALRSNYIIHLSKIGLKSKALEQLNILQKIIQQDNPIDKAILDNINQLTSVLTTTSGEETGKTESEKTESKESD